MVVFRKFSQWFDTPPSNKSDAGRRLCACSGCPDEGIYRAPKSRYHLESGVDDWHWFCLIHVRDYNARWNYYANMTEAQVEQERRADTTWQRPSWPLGACAGGRKTGQAFQDPFDLFRESPSSPHTPFQSAFLPQSPENKALAVLGLSWPFSPDNLRQRYRALVKKYHPDTNSGSAEAEEAIKRINEAYEILKRVG